MTERSIRNAVFTFVLVLLLAACVPNTERPSLDELMADAQDAAAKAAADGHDHEHGPDDDADHEHATDADDEEPHSVKAQDAATEESNIPAAGTAAADTDTTSRASEPSPSVAPSPQPAGPTLEQHDDFPIGVTVSPLCVERGGEMAIRVETGRPDTAVAYLAFYAGEESGAPPPYGDGHGGNSGDMTGGNGRYEDTWRVSPTAPVGPARVEVMAAYNSEKSTELVRFEVVDVGTGGC